MANKPNPIDGMTVALEDCGQDFLEFDIKDGRIVATRPCQGWVWNGKEVANKQIHPGRPIYLKTDGEENLRLNYLVESVRPLEMVRIGPLDV